jgi:predicted nucleic acid-binding protein
MVLVDSSVWIESMRRQGDLLSKVALRALLEEYEAATCGPVLLEVLGGARKENRKEMQEDFKVIPHIQAGPKDWAAAIENAWKLRGHGHSLPWNDVLIGTIALRRQLRAYANDRHFGIMEQVLGLGLYTPGYGGSYNPR